MKVQNLEKKKKIHKNTFPILQEPSTVSLLNNFNFV